MAFEQKKEGRVNGSGRIPGPARSTDEGWYDPAGMTMFLWGRGGGSHL
jgi:hypothetical protein